jgi:hypothetical protein
LFFFSESLSCPGAELTSLLHSSFPWIFFEVADHFWNHTFELFELHFNYFSY